jgi:hypothetical protein
MITNSTQKVSPQPDFETEKTYIFICQNSQCELNPTISTVPFCALCGGANCAMVVDGREGHACEPILANSKCGLELQHSMRM